MKLLRILISLIVALAAVLVIAVPALALEEPTTVSLDDIAVFGALIEDEDFLAVVPYNIAFTSEPEPNIDATFIFRLLSPDGSTENGTALAVPAYNGGYGYGVVSFYFSSGMEWGEAYIFRVQQNPTYYPTAQYWDFTIGESNYSTASDQAAALKAKIVDSATFLAPLYEVNLLAKSEAGSTVLSTYGELYYLDVIPQLNTMCPNLFSVQLENPDYTQRTWDTAFAENLETKYEDTIFGDFMTGFAGLFSSDVSTTMSILSLIVFAILVGLSVYKFKGTMLSAFIDGYALLILLMLMGFFSMIAAGGMAFCSVVLGGIILFLNRA